MHLIKVMSNTKKKLYKEGYEANQMLSGCVFSSNAYAFIENLKNQINSTVFNHTCYKLFFRINNMSEFFLKNIF